MRLFLNLDDLFTNSSVEEQESDVEGTHFMLSADNIWRCPASILYGGGTACDSPDHDHNISV